MWGAKCWCRRYWWSFPTLRGRSPWLRRSIRWGGPKSGKTSAIWAEKNSTKTCSKCGFKVEGGLAPDVREWDCPSCSTHHLRDENAASNGLKYVFSKNKFPCSGLLTVHVSERCALRFDGLGLLVINRGSSTGL